MSHENQGIQHFSKMNAKDKSYLVKLIATLVTAIIAGLITGPMYHNDGGVASVGFGLWLAVVVISSWVIKKQYNLGEIMTDVQIVRHGIALGFLSYIFLWTIVFQFTM